LGIRAMQLICKECNKSFRSKRSFRQYCCREHANIATGRTRGSTTLEHRDMVWSCGGGVDSTAIAILITQGKLPKPDYAVMVDCGYERQSTMNYVKDVITPRLGDMGVRMDVIRTVDYGTNELFDNNGRLRIPAFRKNDDGTISKLNTHCNGGWKVAIVKRWLRELGVEACENWVGIAANESKRMSVSKYKWFTHRYPLVELGYTREDCVYLIGAAGWPLPQRSACYFCPMQTDRQYSLMRQNEPEEFEKACVVEDQIQAKDNRLWLRKSCVPLRESIAA